MTFQSDNVKAVAVSSSETALVTAKHRSAALDDDSSPVSTPVFDKAYIQSDVKRTNAPSVTVMQPDVKRTYAPSIAVTQPVAWVLSDKAGLRQSVLQTRGYTTMGFHHDLHSKKHLHEMLQALTAQQPAVMWIRLAGPAAGSGNRVDSRRTDNLIRIARAQQSAGRSLVLEANAKSGAWHMQAVQELCLTLHTSLHRWCRHERLLPNEAVPCNAVFRLCTNFFLPEHEKCLCPTGVAHVHSKVPVSEGRLQVVLQSMVDVALGGAGAETLVHKADNGHSHGQPESHLQSAGHSSVPEVATGTSPSNANPTQVDDVCFLSTKDQVSESLARQKLECKDFSCDTCLSVLQAAPLKSHRHLRQKHQIQSTDLKEKGCYAMGLFSYGSFFGITRNVYQLP